MESGRGIGPTLKAVFTIALLGAVVIVGPVGASSATCQGWKAVASPNAATGGGQENVLQGVTVISSSRAWAVGNAKSFGTDRTLIERWNGTA
jgi:hypothetical protein